MKAWTTCPGCGWNYEAHGDTHMSTRFKCPRSRNTVPNYDRGLMGRISDYVPIPDSIPQVTADAQTEAVKLIMAEQKLDFGPAYDVYIATPPCAAVDMSGWGAA